MKKENEKASPSKYRLNKKKALEKANAEMEAAKAKLLEAKGPAFEAWVELGLAAEMHEKKAYEVWFYTKLYEDAEKKLRKLLPRSNQR